MAYCYGIITDVLNATSLLLAYLNLKLYDNENNVELKIEI